MIKHNWTRISWGLEYILELYVHWIVVVDKLLILKWSSSLCQRLLLLFEKSQSQIERIRTSSMAQIHVLALVQDIMYINEPANGLVINKLEMSKLRLLASRVIRDHLAKRAFLLFPERRKFLSLQIWKVKNKKVLFSRSCFCLFLLHSIGMEVWHAIDRSSCQIDV